MPDAGDPTPNEPHNPPDAPRDEPTNAPATLRRVMIVVGAHLRAEAVDRPLAYRVAEAVRDWCVEHAEQLSVRIEPVVLTDIWYLNHDELQDRPTISVGGPGVNALSNAFAQTIGHEETGEPTVLIQFDPEYTDLRCCVWGTDHALTVKGIDLFLSDYLDDFLRAVATQVVPDA